MTGLKDGLVQVYTGDGKGKTTAALGLALRAAGHGLRVCVIQFAKAPVENGERRALERLEPSITIHAFGAPQWGDPGKAPPGTPWWLLPPSEEDREQAQLGMELAHDSIVAGQYDVVVLDEIFAVLRYDLVSLDQVMGLLRARPAHVELVLTGRGAPKEIIEAADLVTEMKSIKHPFEQGTPARRGVDF